MAPQHGMPPPGNMGPTSDRNGPHQHPYAQQAPPPGLQSYGIASEMGLGGNFPPNGHMSNGHMPNGHMSNGHMPNGVMRPQHSGAGSDLSQQHFAGTVRPHDTTLPEELPRKRNRQ